MDCFNLNADLHPITSATVGFDPHPQTPLPANEETGGGLMGVNPWGMIAPFPPVNFTWNQTDFGEHRGYRL